MTAKEPDDDRMAGSDESSIICGFGPCNCPVENGVEFCAPTCRFGLGSKDEPCKCGHGGCSATSGEG